MLSPEQLAMRHTGIGGSEIGVLAGLSRWSTPIAIYEAKVNGAAPLDSFRVEFGLEFEAPIANLYARREGRFLVPCGTIRHPERPFAFATLDRAVFSRREDFAGHGEALTREELAGAEKGLEIKTTTWRLAREWGEPGSDQVPDYYLAQATWEMGCTGIHRLDMAVLFDADRLEVYRLEFNARLFDALCEIAARFMRDHVQARRPPPPDASDAYAHYLERQFPAGNGQILPASPELEDSVIRYAQLKEAAKRLEQLTELEKNRIRAAIGEADGLESARFGRLTWKKTKDTTTFDAAAAYQDARAVAALLVERLPAGPEREGLEKRLRELETAHRKTRAGFRRFHGRWAGEADLALRRLSLSLDAVTTEEENQHE